MCVLIYLVQNIYPKYFPDIFRSLDGIWDFPRYQEMGPEKSQKYLGVTRSIGGQKGYWMRGKRKQHREGERGKLSAPCKSLWDPHCGTGHSSFS